MSFRRGMNRHDFWREIVRENSALLTELPGEALTSEQAFRGYVTSGVHQGRRFTPAVSALSRRALEDLFAFIQDKAQFDMDAIRFDDFNAAFRTSFPPAGDR